MIKAIPSSMGLRYLDSEYALFSWHFQLSFLFLFFEVYRSLLSLEHFADLVRDIELEKPKNLTRMLLEIKKKQRVKDLEFEQWVIHQNNWSTYYLDTAIWLFGQGFTRSYFCSRKKAQCVYHAFISEKWKQFDVHGINHTYIPPTFVSFISIPLLTRFVNDPNPRFVTGHGLRIG